MSYQASLATAKLYKSVIDEVINGVREAFMDEGIDEQVLQELKTIWEAKVLATKAVDTLSDQPPERERTTAASSSGHHNRSVINQASHSSAGTTADMKHVIASANANSNVTSVLQTAPPHQPSVLVAAPARSTMDPATHVGAAVAAGGGGFPHLAGQQMLQQNASMAAAMANFAALQSAGVITGPGHSMIIPGNVPLQVPVRLVNAAQLPTIPAHHVMQINQNPAQQRRGMDGTRNGGLPQVDGPGGISDDEDDFEDEEDSQEPTDEPVDAVGVEEGEPLNSEDDVSNEDAEEMFESDNVVVCQYEKVTRTRNKWKFVLKDGVMNLDGKDYVFNRANGEAEF